MGRPSSVDGTGDSPHVAPHAYGAGRTAIAGARPPR